MSAAAEPPLLEREAELAELAEAVGRLAGHGTGGVVLIEGPPGIGKSALLAAAVRRAEGCRVLRARGSELESMMAFGAVRELLGPALRRLPADERDALLAGPGHLAARVLGYVRDERPAVALEDPRYALTWVLEGLAERSPCLLAIDDLHWLDEESARFVDYLVPRLVDLPVLLVATARPDEPGTPRLGEPVSRGRVLRPGPLSVDAVERLAAGHDPVAVHRATGGNPLLALELARAPAGTPVDAIGLESVGRAVLDRARRVSAEAVALAEAVSLFAGGATLEDAAVVAGLDPLAAASHADRLVAAQVLAPGDTLEFLHPVARASVYERLGAFGRRNGHTVAARALRERGARVEAVAAHLLASTPQGDHENVRILRAAADEALAAAAPRGAVRYLQRALAEPIPDGEERARTLHVLGRLQGVLARPETVETLRSAAAATIDTRRRADVTADLAAVLQVLGRSREAIDLLEELAGYVELDAERRLTVDGLLAGCALDAGRRETFDAAIARLPADLAGTTPAQRLALRWGARRAAMAGAPHADVVALLERAVAEDGSSMFGEFGSWLGDVAGELLEAQQLEPAERLALARAEVAQAEGREAEVLSALRTRGLCAAMRGHLVAAEELLGTVLGRVPADTEIAWSCSSMLAEVLARRGRATEARALLDGLPEQPAWQAIAALRRAVIDSVEGRHDEYEAFRVAAVHGEADGWTSVSSGGWIWCHYAEGLAHDGRPGEARDLLDGLRARAASVGDDHLTGLVDLALGRIAASAGEQEEAETLLLRAVEGLARTPNELQLGHARLEFGAALRRAGRRVECRPPLELALDYAERHGAAVLAGHAREQLRMTGARPRSGVRSGSDALTPAEARVARLAAAGRSNREIASELFLTVGTVKTSLVRVYRKLDVAAREELAGKLLPPG